MLLAQLRTQFANEIRKRDLTIQRMKERLADARRGGRPGPSTIVITGNTPTAGWEEGEEGRLGQETTEFLTELSQGLADENDALLALVRRCLSQLKAVQGLPDDEHVEEVADQGSLFIASPAKCEVLAQELEQVMASLQEMLNQPDYVPIEELAERDEVIRLREEEVRALKARCDTLHEEWRKAIDLVDGWNKKLGESVGGGDGLIPPMDEEGLVAAVKKGREGRDKKKDGRHTRRKSRKNAVPESIEEEDEEEMEDMVVVQEQIPAEARKSHKKRSRKSVPDALPEEPEDIVVVDTRTPPAKPRSRRSTVPQVVEESESEQPVENTIQLTRTPAKKRSRRSVAPQAVEESEDELSVDGTLQLSRTPILTPTPARKRNRRNITPQVVDEADDEQPAENTPQNTRNKKRNRRSAVPQAVEEIDEEPPMQDTVQLTRTPAKKRSRKSIAPQAVGEEEEEELMEDTIQVAEDPAEEHYTEPKDEYEEEDSITVIPIQEMDRSRRRSERNVRLPHPLLHFLTNLSPVSSFGARARSALEAETAEAQSLGRRLPQAFTHAEEAAQVHAASIWATRVSVLCYLIPMRTELFLSALYKYVRFGVRGLGDCLFFLLLIEFLYILPLMRPL